MLHSSGLIQIPFMAEALDDNAAITFEQKYHLAMQEMRQRNLSSFTESRMPFALKQRQIELPMIDYSVTLALSAPKWRQVVVRALLENIEKGPGHLSVHRAKDALKQIAASIGLNNLVSMMSSTDPTESAQAVHLLGWLKNARAANPLVASYRKGHPCSDLIASVVAQHYPAYEPK
jgi:hypothetical protein